jgi:hypothetical protein
VGKEIVVKEFRAMEVRIIFKLKKKLESKPVMDSNL